MRDKEGKGMGSKGGGMDRRGRKGKKAKCEVSGGRASSRLAPTQTALGI